MNTKEETLEEQVKRVLAQMVEDGEVDKISIDGEDHYMLLTPQGYIDVEDVKFKPRKKNVDTVFTGEGNTKILKGEEKALYLRKHMQNN